MFVLLRGKGRLPNHNYPVCSLSGECYGSLTRKNAKKDLLISLWLIMRYNQIYKQKITQNQIYLFKGKENWFVTIKSTI